MCLCLEAITSIFGVLTDPRQMFINVGIQGHSRFRDTFISVGENAYNR